MVSVPVQMDDGRIRVFTGFHVNTIMLGPYMEFAITGVDVGEVTALYANDLEERPRTWGARRWLTSPTLENERSGNTPPRKSPRS